MDHTVNDLLKPTPRPAKSTPELHQIQVRNRRHEYLERHPSYYTNMDHELKNPILYERLIKRFQTPAQRQAEGKAKGYGRTLEADLLRGEERLSTLTPSHRQSSPAPATSSPSLTAHGLSTETIQSTSRSHAPGEGEREGPWSEEEPETKEDALRLWRSFLEDYFISGRDEDFAYETVDEDETLDELRRRDEQDAWFDEEDPELVDEKGERTGQTGVQDY